MLHCNLFTVYLAAIAVRLHINDMYNAVTTADLDSCTSVVPKCICTLLHIGNQCRHLGEVHEYFQYPHMY